MRSSNTNSDPSGKGAQGSSDDGAAEAAGRGSGESYLPTPGRGLGWALVFLLVYASASLAYAFGYHLFLSFSEAGGGATEPADRVAAHLQSLDGLAGMFVVQFLFLMPVIIAASQFRSQNWRQTLALRPVSLSSVGIWIGIWLLYQGASALFDFLVEIPVDPLIRDASGSQHLGFSLIVVFLAPVLEETLFRGYLFKALRYSWLGLHGTVIATSVFFTLMHALQYNLLVMAQLFVLAMILGYARVQTGSLLMPIILHALNNLLAVIVIVYLGLS